MATKNVILDLSNKTLYTLYTNNYVEREKKKIEKSKPEQKQKQEPVEEEPWGPIGNNLRFDVQPETDDKDKEGMDAVW